MMHIMAYAEYNDDDAITITIINAIRFKKCQEITTKMLTSCIYTNAR